MGAFRRAPLERLIIMGRTFRHDNKNSWSKPKFKRTKNNKKKVSTIIDDYDDIDSVSKNLDRIEDHSYKDCEETNDSDIPYK